MKSWFLAFAAVLVAAYFLITPFRSVAIPGMLQVGTEQMIAQLRDAMLAYKADEGKYPPVDPDLDPRESYLLHLTGENKAGKEYLDRSSIRVQITAPMDGWGNELIFDPEANGDLSHIVSAGQDGIQGTADDIDSRYVKQRNIPVPPELVDDRAAKRKAEAKTAAAKAKSNPTEAPAEGLTGDENKDKDKVDDKDAAAQPSPAKP